MKLLAIPTALLLTLSFGCGGADTPAQSSASSSSASQEAAPTQDIVDIAVGAGNFTTLVAALTAADLVDALKGSGPFTVFAPTDEAFARLPEGTVEALLADKEALTKVLLFHVVSGDVRAEDVTRLESAETLQGQSLWIDTSNGVRVGNASVVATDIVATNGVIHVIDSVLIPE